MSIGMTHATPHDGQHRRSETASYKNNNGTIRLLRLLFLVRQLRFQHKYYAKLL